MPYITSIAYHNFGIYYSLGFRNELVSVVPILQEICGLLVIYSDVMVLEKPGEEIINLPCNIQDVTYAEEMEKWSNQQWPHADEWMYSLKQREREAWDDSDAYPLL